MSYDRRDKSASSGKVFALVQRTVAQINSARRNLERIPSEQISAAHVLDIQEAIDELSETLDEL